MSKEIDQTREMPPKERKTVDTTPSLRSLALQIANKNPHFTDMCSPHGIEFASPMDTLGKDMVEPAVAEDVLTQAISRSLESGKLVVINDDTRRNVIGFQATEQGLAVEVISRFIQKDNDAANTSLLLPENTAVTSRFGTDGALTIDFMTDEAETKGMSISIPGRIAPGQQVVISAAEITLHEEETDPVHREAEYTKDIWVLEKATEERTSSHKIESKKYRRTTLVTKVSFHDDGFLYKTAYPAHTTILAVNGFHHAPWAYLKPSGWFVAVGEEPSVDSKT